MYQSNNFKPAIEYNKRSRNLLIAAIALMVLSFIFPVIALSSGVTANGSQSLYIYNLLNTFGLMLVLASIAAMYQAFRVAKMGKTNKIWAWGSVLLVILPILAINGITGQIKSRYGFSSASNSLGFYSMILSIILAIVAGFYSTNSQINPSIQNLQNQPVNEYTNQNQYLENSSSFEYEDEIPAKNMEKPILNNSSVSIYCSNCGKLNENAKYCEICGTKL